jgi:guanylate kinase
MKSKSLIFIVVGTPGSGKDILIQAVNDLGVLHAVIVPKHTSRKRQKDDGNEMICSDDDNYDMTNCDIKYDNYGDSYGLKSEEIWNGIKKEIIQVLVISNVKAINQIKERFGSLVKLLFIHSEINEEEYLRQEKELEKPEDYVAERLRKYKHAFNIYFNNFNLFDHVLLYSNSPEDLFDQLFRIFKYYEN